MVYNDIEFSKRGVEASILSIKNDINRKIGLVELRYNDVYNAIIEENNKLVDFLNEFRAAGDAIVNECNDLQGLTDEELTEIKQKIEELKEILDSIDIPDLPKIKKPDEIFSEPSNGNDKPQGGCVSGFCAIGVGAQVSGSSPLPGKDGGNNATTFGCYDYTATDGGVGLCNKNYVVWGNCSAENGICVTNYNEELDNQCSLGYAGHKAGCLSRFIDGDSQCYSSFIIDMCVNEDNGSSCGSGYMSSNVDCGYMYGEDTDYARCESNFATRGINVGDAPSTTCEESYFHDGATTVCNGYGTQDGNCPQSYQVADGMTGCVADYKDGDTECKNNFEKTNDSQSISACTGGFTDGTTSCEGRWQDSEVGNMSACQRNYRNGRVSCTKNYVTDGHFVYCDNSDSACRRCVNCDSCVGGANCSSCNSPSCFSCYGKSNGSSPPCGESTPCEQCPDHTPVQPCKCCHNSIGWDYFLCQANGDDT